MKKVLAILIVLCMALSIAACGGGSSGKKTDSESARDTLTVAVTMDIGTLNSREMWGGDFKTLSRMYSEPLIDFYADGSIRCQPAVSACLQS